MRLMHYFLDINGGLCFQKTYMNSNKSLHAIKSARMYRSTRKVANTKIKMFRIFYGTGISCHNLGIHPHFEIFNDSHAVYSRKIFILFYICKINFLVEIENFTAKLCWK